MLFINQGWIVISKKGDKIPPTPKEVQEDLLNNPDVTLIAVSTLQYKGNEDNAVFFNVPKTEYNIPSYAMFVVSYPTNQFYT